MMATNPGRAWAHTPSQDPGSGQEAGPISTPG